MLQNWVLQHAEWEDRVTVEYNHVLHSNHAQGEVGDTPIGDTSNAISRLLALKKAMRQVHDNLLSEHVAIEAKSLEDKQGWALMYVKAVEAYRFDKAARASACYNVLCSTGKPALRPACALNPRELSVHIQAVRDHIVELARDDIAQDIQELQHHKDDQAGDRMHKKEHILKKLKRLSPGESNTLNCVMDGDGSLHSDPASMARALVSHWEQVFSASSCDSALLQDWMTQLFPKASRSSWNTGLLEASNGRWRILREHVEKAVKFSKNSMPGPDGLPYAFWSMALLLWIYNYNRILRPDGRCPYEMRFGKLPNHDKLQWFGQQVFLMIEPDALKKFDPRGIHAVLLG